MLLSTLWALALYPAPTTVVTHRAAPAQLPVLLRRFRPPVALDTAPKQALGDGDDKLRVGAALSTLLPGLSSGALSAVSEAEAAAEEGVPEAELPGTLASLQAHPEQNAAMLADYERLLEEAYEASRVITKEYAKTFYFGTSFFNEEKRKAVWAVYAWCRRTDDIVDKPRSDRSSLRDELQQWRQRLRDIWRGRAHDLIDLALVDTVKNYPALSIQPFEDMIKGMVMDLDQCRFETFDELYVYCYRVAGTVGLMTMPIMGTAPGSSYEEALEPALALGVALQLTNILRDVGEDRIRRRIYLPQEDLVRFNITEAQLLKGVKDEKYVAMLKFQIARAREWYTRAEEGIPMLAEDARLPVRASLDMYGSILDKIEANNYDNFNKRAYTAKWEKLLMLPGSWAKVNLGK